MAGSRANVNDFLLGRDNGEGQLPTESNAQYVDPGYRSSPVKGS
jgi:hypothetical protein